MFFLISFFLVIGFLKWKKSSFLLFFSGNFILFSFIIDGIYWDLFDDQMRNGFVRKDFSLIYIWASYLFGFLVFSIIIEPDRKNEKVLIDKSYSDFLMWFFFSISLVVTLFNTYRAGSIVQLFITPRIWEANFGRYPLLNYLYFLHVLSAFISLIQFKLHKKGIYIIVFILSIILSVFHGIKMSIAHAIILPSFAFYVMNSYRVNKTILNVALFFIAIIVSFFVFVRGGDMSGLWGYLTSGSVNSIYKIQNSDIIINSPIGTIIPDIVSMFGWIVKRYSDNKLVSNNPGEGFILNDQYNTFHPISDSFLTVFTFFSLPLFLALVINSVKKRNFVTVPNLFLESFLLYSCFMFFWSWIFWQIKIIYLVFVLYIAYDIVNLFLLKKHSHHR